jgi:hypothetical protein
MGEERGVYRVLVGKPEGKRPLGRPRRRWVDIRYLTIILPILLYGCETWSLTLQKERKLRVFENMALRRIFGPKRDKVMGDWRRLHNEELNDLYSSPNIVGLIKLKRMRWAGHVAHMGEERGV